MSLQAIHLRKLMKLMYLTDSRQISSLRADIRDDIARERGAGGDGGDFYGPFWRDSKDHVFGLSDLRDTTRARVAGNAGRTNLYPQLRDGFLLWWDERRRWTNEPFRPANSLKTICRLPRVDADIKVANLLSVRDGQDEDHFVYPYWFPDPILSEEAARLMLWVLCQAFPTIKQEEFRVLDVIRGRTFSLDRNPPSGDEGINFERKFNHALHCWRELRREYD